MSRIGKSIETGSRLVVTRPREREELGVTRNRYNGSFVVDKKKVLELDSDDNCTF